MLEDGNVNTGDVGNAGVLVAVADGSVVVDGNGNDDGDGDGDVPANSWLGDGKGDEYGTWLKFIGGMLWFLFDAELVFKLLFRFRFRFVAVVLLKVKLGLDRLGMLDIGRSSALVLVSNP